jgi:hypothetical protein
MTKKAKIYIIVFGIISVVFVEVLRLHYMIESVGITKKIKIQKNYNQKLKKEITKTKIKLTEKMDLDRIRNRAENELGMESSKDITYFKIKENVPK